MTADEESQDTGEEEREPVTDDDLAQRFRKLSAEIREHLRGLGR
ncbi:hypothetical protein V1J52_08575 [Streptomyces sp. TRM 70351]|nr:hypothetical protein [Streptomyces sp. TRM 70351]MEE1928247.1 hypothetical protein [Streptomyces sp. TRM 70351]